MCLGRLALIVLISQNPALPVYSEYFPRKNHVYTLIIVTYVCHLYFQTKAIPLLQEFVIVTPLQAKEYQEQNTNETTRQIFITNRSTLRISLAEESLKADSSFMRARPQNTRRRSTAAFTIQIFPEQVEQQGTNGSHQCRSLRAKELQKLNRDNL